MNRIPRFFFTATALAGTALGQVKSPSEFEVASVKPNTLNDRIVTIDVGPGGRFLARGYTLVLLIQRAYEVMDWNVSEGPGWIRDDRWDVDARAKMQGNLTDKTLQPMLRALLADRFKLKMHTETRDMAAAALTIARGGLKATVTPNETPNRDTFRFTGNGLSGQGISMRDFARFVCGKMAMVCVDQTGLTGFYDVKATWPTDDQSPPPPGIDPREAQQAKVMQAIEQQLGLKIVRQKVPIEMLIIDHVEKATAN